MSWAGLRHPTGQCLAAGAVLPLAYAPFGALPVAVIAYVVFYKRMITAPSIGRAAAWGWLFGFGQFVSGLYWIGSAVLVEADRYWWLLPFAVFGLPAVLACFVAAATASWFWLRLRFLPWLSFRIGLWSGFLSERQVQKVAQALPASTAAEQRRGPAAALGDALLLALLLAVAEFIRATCFSGFPWNSPIMIWVEWHALSQITAWLGVAAGNLVVLIWLLIPAALWISGGPKKALMVTMMTLIGVGGAGYFYALQRQVVMASGPEIAIIQPNIEQSDKWRRGSGPHIVGSVLAATASAEQAAWIIWPETALPYYLDEEPAFPDMLRQTLRPHQTLVTGALRRGAASATAQRNYYNSMQVWSSTGQMLDSSDKVRLVPFGEYLPFQETLEGLGFSQLTRLRGGFTPGLPDPMLNMADGTRFVPLICYEAIFPLMTDHRDAVRVLINATNDAWFGHTAGPHQHLALARLRSLETGLPMIRAANTGISAVIDGTGRVVAHLPLATGGVLSAVVPPALAAPAQFGYSGRIFIVLLSIGFILCFLTLTRR